MNDRSRSKWTNAAQIVKNPRALGGGVAVAAAGVALWNAADATAFAFGAGAAGAFVAGVEVSRRVFSKNLKVREMDYRKMHRGPESNLSTAMTIGREIDRTIKRLEKKRGTAVGIEELRKSRADVEQVAEESRAVVAARELPDQPQGRRLRRRLGLERLRDLDNP